MTWGVGAGLLSSASYGLMAFLVHFSSGRIPASELTFTRGILGCVLLLPIVYRQLPMLLQQESKYLWARNVAGSVSILCFAWNLQHTTVGIANALFNIAPLLVLFGEWCAREKWPRFRQFAFFVLVTIGTTVYWRSDAQQAATVVYAVGLLGAAAASCSYLALKKATATTGPWLITWGVCFATALLSALSNRSTWIFPNGRDSVVVILIGILSFAGQYFVVQSFANLSASAASVLVPSSIVWAVVADLAAHGHSSSSVVTFGSLLYVLGTALALSEELKVSSVMNAAPTI